MASKKDMRRVDLIVPYTPDENKDGNDFQSTMTSTLPMAAIFTRNKLLGWTAVLFATQQWLSESPAQRDFTASNGILSVAMAVLSLGVGYMPLFLPPSQAPLSGGSGTEAPPAVPPS